MISCCVLLCAWSAAGASIETVKAELNLRSSGAGPALPSPMPRRVTLSEDRPPQVKSPADKPGLLWAVIPFGPAQMPARGFALAVDESDPARAGLRVDLNQNDDLTDDPQSEWKLIDGDRPESSRYEGAIELPVGTAVGAPRARLVAYRYLAQAAKARGLPEDLLFVYRDYAAAGTVEIATTRLPIIVADEASLGDFTYPAGAGAAELMIGIDVNGDGLIRPGPPEWMRSNARATIFGREVSLKSLSGDGRQIELLVAPPGVEFAFPFAGKTLDDKPVRFPEDYKNKVVLVHFWASWCGYCKREAPTLVETVKRFADNPSFAVLGVCVDKANARDAARTYAASAGLSWPHVVDDGPESGFSGPIAKMYGVRGVPKLLLIDAQAMTVLASGDALRGAQLPTTLAQYVAKPPGAAATTRPQP